MKDKIKKIGVIGLLVAFLLPFFEMPTVKAAEEDCTHHLQQYIFLATSVSGYFGNPEYDCANGDFGNDCTFEFNNTGMYPYVFPVPLSNETIRIDSIGEMELYGNRESKSAVYDYWNTYKYILNKELDASDKYYYSGRYSSADYYNRVKNTKVDIFGGYAVLKNSSGKTYSLKYDNYTDYETVTAIMHGKFNELNEDGKIKKTDDANWGDSINPTEKTKMTLQQVFDKTNTTGLKNTFALAELSNNKYTSVSLYHGKDFRESLEYLTNNIEQAKEDGLVDVYSGDNYINLHIQREYTLTALNSLNYGDSSQNKIYSTTQGSITDSYTAYTRARDCTGDDYKSKGCTKKYTQDKHFWMIQS